MKLSAFVVACVFATAHACGGSTELWGQGTCDYPGETAGGNGPPLSSDIVNQLATCFTSNFGAGPYTIDGVDIPDAGGQGNAWGISTIIDGNPFSLTVGNLCNCAQSMDANIFDDLASISDSGTFLTVKETCGANSDACPAAAAPGRKLMMRQDTLPSGMYASAYSCPDNPCDLGDYQMTATC
ncbi:hypothetical protein MMC10_005786 [Thelotrema lepadinum]|nr:hypothetical protein [Thelotrema lepadinum]